MHMKVSDRLVKQTSIARQEVAAVCAMTKA